MSFIKTTTIDRSVPHEAPRVFAPATARIRKDPAPWDAEVITSALRNVITAESAMHPGDCSHPDERN